jgi:hypothetical protein
MALNPMEILKHLNKSNCGECGEKTCLAFAAAVAREQKSLTQCPYVEDEIVQQLGEDSGNLKSSGSETEEVLNRLKDRLSKIDFAEASKRLDAPLEDDRLTLKVLGKNFSVDSKGTFFSEIHIHSWLTLPVLNYILDGKGVEPSGNWVPLRELKGGKDWGRFFEHRCEKPMKKLADTYPDFFADMLHVFSGRQVDRHYESDISLVLYPLPKLPILICYWRPEDGLESDLHLFFDTTAEDNLNIDSIYSLMTGMLVMFEKIARRHN